MHCTVYFVWKNNALVDGVDNAEMKGDGGMHHFIFGSGRGWVQEWYHYYKQEYPKAKERAVEYE